MHPLRTTLVTFLAAWIGLAAAPAKEMADYVAAAPFAMPAIKRPTFPDHSVSIVDFGAVCDGQTLNTDAFAKAIEACAKAGGGHVQVPPGLWLTGPIELKSNVHLHVQRGALIQFTPDHTQYPMTRSKGEKNYTVTPPIFGRDLKNIAITGEGIIDGAGHTWRPVKREKTTDAQWKALLAQSATTSNEGKIWWPTKEAMTGEDYLRNLQRSGGDITAEQMAPSRDFLRPNLLHLNNCQDVLIEGVTLRNSPKFVLYPSRCTNVSLQSVNVFNEWWAQNGDGIDLSACQNAIVYRCNVSAGDDAICMKSSGKPPAGQEAALQNVIVAECTVYHGHGGFVIGSNTDGGMRNIWVTQCTFIGTDIGIRVKSGIGRGGVVRDITIDGVAMRDIEGEAILFETSYQDMPASAAAKQDKKAEPAEKVPEFRDFKIRNVVCKGAEMALRITGLPQQAVHDIQIEDSVIEADRGVEAAFANAITLRRVKLIAHEQPLMKIADTAKIDVVEK